MDPIAFTSELWVWEPKKPSTNWILLAVPDEFTEEIRMLGGPARGFGSIRVEVTLRHPEGDQTWRTSVFPEKDRGFVLPVKASVRRRAGLEAGDCAAIELRVVEP